MMAGIKILRDTSLDCLCDEHKQSITETRKRHSLPRPNPAPPLLPARSSPRFAEEEEGLILHTSMSLSADALQRHSGIYAAPRGPSAYGMRTQSSAAYCSDDSQFSEDNYRGSSASGSSASSSSQLAGEPDTVARVFPRRKLGEKARCTDQPVLLTLDSLTPYFHLPLKEAADRLGLCPTAVKTACRKFGLDRWPFRRGKRTEASNPTGPSSLSPPVGSESAMQPILPSMPWQSIGWGMMACSWPPMGMMNEKQNHAGAFYSCGPYERPELGDRSFPGPFEDTEPTRPHPKNVCNEPGHLDEACGNDAAVWNGCDMSFLATSLDLSG